MCKKRDESKVHHHELSPRKRRKTWIRASQCHINLQQHQLWTETVDHGYPVEEFGQCVLQRRMSSVSRQAANSAEQNWKQNTKHLVVQLSQNIEYRNQHFSPYRQICFTVLQNVKAFWVISYQVAHKTHSRALQNVPWHHSGTCFMIFIEIIRKNRC